MRRRGAPKPPSLGNRGSAPHCPHNSTDAPNTHSRANNTSYPLPYSAHSNAPALIHRTPGCCTHKAPRIDAFSDNLSYPIPNFVSDGTTVIYCTPYNQAYKPHSVCSTNTLFDKSSYQFSDDKPHH